MMCNTESDARVTQQYHPKSIMRIGLESGVSPLQVRSWESSLLLFNRSTDVFRISLIDFLKQRQQRITPHIDIWLRLQPGF